MLSAKPLAVQAAEGLLPEPSGKDLRSLSAVASSESVGAGILEVTPFPSTPEVGSVQLSTSVRKGNVVTQTQTSPLSLLLNSVPTSLNDPNNSSSPAERQSVPGDKNGQNFFLQNVGQNLLGNNLSPESPSGSFANAGNRDSGGPLLGVGNLPLSGQNAGLDDFFTGQGNLLLNQNGAANNLLSSGAGGLLLGGGVFLNRGPNASGSGLHVAGGSFTAAPVILVSTLSESSSQRQGDGTEPNAGQGAIGSSLQTSQVWASSNPVVGRWLSATWTASAPENRVGEVVAYPQVGFGQSVSPTLPSANLAAPKPVSIGVGINADRGPQLSGYAVGVATALGGQDHEWLEKPGNGSAAFAKAGPTSETFDTGAAAANESSSRDPVLGTGLIGLGTETVAWQARADATTAHVSDLTTSRVNADPNSALTNVAPLCLPIMDSVSRMGLLQLEVAKGAPVPTDTSMRDAGGSTAAYLGMEQSSIWSIVTTYSLVILPRQRRPQPTILVVDPDDATRDAVNVALVREGYFVLPAASVRDAWGMLRTPHARIDLVLMDPHLPDVSGIHLCARLREISPTVPVMVCAGDVEPAEVDQLRQLGVRYYLRKPIAFEELLHTVRAILA